MLVTPFGSVAMSLDDRHFTFAIGRVCVISTHAPQCLQMISVSRYPV